MMSGHDPTHHKTIRKTRPYLDRSLDHHIHSASMLLMMVMSQYDNVESLMMVTIITLVMIVMGDGGNDGNISV